MIRPAMMEDIPRIIDDLLWDFAAETGEPSEYDPVQSAFTLGRFLSEVFYVKDDGGKIRGICCAGVERQHKKNPMAYMHLLYVAKAHRGSVLGWRLLDRTIKETRRRGAVCFYAGSAAGMGDGGAIDETLLNLYKKMDFQILGCFARRDLR